MECIHQMEDVGNLSIAHYKEFRSNHHTSKNPKSRFKFGVLGSRYFDVLARLDHERLEKNLILFDVIYNNSEELLDLPFDSSHKSLPQERRSLLKKVECESYLAGQVFFDNVSEQDNCCLQILKYEKEYAYAENPLELLLDEAKRSMSENGNLISQCFGHDFLVQCEQKLKEIPAKGRQNLHAEGAFLHALVLLDILKTAIRT